MELNPMNILKPKDVIQRTGLSKVTIWRLERAGEFPKRIFLSDRCRGWDEEEINKWLKTRKRGLVQTAE
jgi:prophage regulatory protein